MRPLPETPPARTCLVILGMHRSGTSALGGVLSLLGCDMPRHPRGAEPQNPKGYFEPRPLNELNDEILASADSRWDDWLAFNPEWEQTPAAAEFSRRAGDILEQEYGGSNFFFFKDPRNCRLFGFWRERLEAANCQPVIISTVRNPWEVALSLQNRDGMPVQYGLLLWLRHTLDAEAAGRGLVRFHTSYEQLLTNWADLASRAAEVLGVAWPRPLDSVAPEIDAFLEGGLRHFRADESGLRDNLLVSDWVRETYDIMNRWACKGEDQADHTRIDALRSAFEAAAPAFVQLARAGADAPQVQARLAAAEARVENQEKLVTRLAEQRATNEVLAARVLELEETKRQEILAVKARMAHQRGRLTAAETQVNSQAQTLEQQSGQICDLEARVVELVGHVEENSTAAQEVVALRNSSSWKITSPLRCIVRRLRRE